MLIRYIQLSQSNLKYLIIGLLSASFGAYYNVFINHYTSLIIQGDFSNDVLWNLYKYCFLSVIFVSIRGALFTYSQKLMNSNIKSQVYKKLIYQSPTFYETTEISYINDLINTDVRAVSDIFSLNINIITRSFFNLITTFYFIYEISGYLCFITIIIILINLFISFIYDKIYKYYMKDFDDINKNVNNFIHQSISNLSIIKTFATENKSFKKFIELDNQLQKLFIYETYLYAFNAFIIFNMPHITIILIILSVKYLQLTTNLINFILHFKSIFQTIKDFIDMKTEMNKSLKSYERVIQILDNPYRIQGLFIPSKPLIPSIQFQNISFKYQKASSPIISNLSFTINPYDKIAIVGSSGCGKSTLAKLLIGLLKNQNGSILIDNIDINIYDNYWIKNQIGYVAQDTILFTDTIANNISYGLETSSLINIIEASKQANADEFISKLPQGYETKMEGTEMSSLSGGQKQRIAIARALIKKPSIIIFDEATSALDPYCEEIVQKTIKDCFDKNKATMIIIAHRKSALEIVDKIYKLENSQLSPLNNF